MASSVDYVFDPYVVDGYAPSDWVNDPYGPDDYVTQAIFGSATLSSSATVTAVGAYLRKGTASVSTSATVTSSAERIRGDSATVNSQATLTATPERIKQFSATVACVASVSSDAVKTTDTSSTVNSTATLSSSGSQTKNGSLSMSGALTASIFGVATVSPGANIIVSATLSSDADRFRTSSAELVWAGDDPYWENALTWGEPRSDVWGPLFQVSATKVAGLIFDEQILSTTATMSVDAIKTARIDISVDSFASLSVDALQISDGVVTMASNANVDAVAAVTNGVLDQFLNCTASISIEPSVVIVGESSISSEFTNSTQGNYTTGSVSKTLDTEATFTLSGNAFRLRRFTTTISSAFTVEADGDRVADGTSLVASAGTMSVKANPLWGPWQQTLDAEATIFINGGVLREGVATLNALNAVLATLTIYSIDPYRIYTIPTESRIATIEADTRIFSIDSENRLNTLEKETRTIQIDSESRYLEVQRLRLFDQFGVKDRREG